MIHGSARERLEADWWAGAFEGPEVETDHVPALDT